MLFLNHIRKRLVYAIGISLIGFGVFSCKKAIEIDPPFNSLSADNVFTKDATAISVLTDIYATLSGQNISLASTNITGINFYASLGADELTLFNLNAQPSLDFYKNDLTINTASYFWNTIYPMIFRVNNAIDGLQTSNSLTLAVKEQLLGEAYFMRAFFYFYLLNMYGDVPLVLNMDWKNNALMSRTPKDDVYRQIIDDLKESQSFLSEKYPMADMVTFYPLGLEERIRPTKWAATALLARTYLYKEDWANAEAQSTLIINNSTQYGLVTLSGAFLKNNKEAIWQLQPVGNVNNSNTGEGKTFVLPSTGPNTGVYPVYLSNYVLNAFEPGDLRRLNWTDSVKPASVAYYYPKKYRIGDVNTTTQEYSTVLRLAEQYLIRAEARAKQNNLTSAIADIDTIRKRAGLPLISTTNPGISQTSLLDKILHERQVELFTEWGHRWFDLKRTRNIDGFMSIITPIKANGSPWRSHQALYPIPPTDILNAPNLSQNLDY